MPSPVGHALGGLIAGRLAQRLVARPASEAERACRGPRVAPARVPGPGGAPGAPWWALAVLAMSPDLDLLVGTHSTYSHSVGAVALVAVLSFLVVWRRTRLDGPEVGIGIGLQAGERLAACGERQDASRRAARAAAIIAAATYGSHLLLDWLGTDTSPPVGIMLWWPFSSGFSKGPVSWFPSVSREVTSRAFWVGNTIAVTFELVTLGPLLWLITRARFGPR